MRHIPNKLVQIISAILDGKWIRKHHSSSRITEGVRRIQEEIGISTTLLMAENRQT